VSNQTKVLYEKTANQTAFLYENAQIKKESAKIASKEFIDNAGTKFNDASERTRELVADAGSKMKEGVDKASIKAREAIRWAQRAWIGSADDAPDH
jgi:vacuolar-type H+-ATPase subunit H